MSPPRSDSSCRSSLSVRGTESRCRVLETFDRLGLERLARVHQALSGAVAYDELHLLRLYALCRASTGIQPENSAAGSGNSRRISPRR
jgi:hypothetical protein